MLRLPLTFAVCAAIHFLSFTSHANQGVTETDDLRIACETLVAAPFDQKAVAELSRHACSTSITSAVRSRLMAICGLSALATRDTNQFLRAKHSHAINFPAEAQLFRFDISDCLSACSDCGKRGVVESEVNCSLCGGSGKCADKDCDNGRWIITQPGYGGAKRTTSVMACRKCSGSGRCPSCNGVSVTRQKCSRCAGQGTVYKWPRSLDQQYTLLLRETLALLQVDESFRESFLRASSEKDLSRRVQALTKLADQFRRHPGIHTVEAMLAEAQIALRAQDVLQREQAVLQEKTQAQYERELSTLRQLRDSRNPSAAALTLKEYLNKNPSPPDRLEIESILNDCLANAARQRRNEKLLYIFGGVLLVLFALSCINIHTYRYTFLPSYSAQNSAKGTPRKNTLTDPLSISARESRWRAKSKTARVPLAED